MGVENRTGLILRTLVVEVTVKLGDIVDIQEDEAYQDEEEDIQEEEDHDLSEEEAKEIYELDVKGEEECPPKEGSLLRESTPGILCRVTSAPSPSHVWVTALSPPTSPSSLSSSTREPISWMYRFHPFPTLC